MTQDDKATAAQFKHDIDSGLTHNMVRHFDAAVAPQGANEEATGTPMPCGALIRERSQQRHLAALDRQDGQSQSSARAVFGWPMLLLFAAISLGVLLSFLGH